jgi:hypothetical protein
LGKILAGGAPLKDTTEVDFDASTRFFSTDHAKLLHPLN